MSSSRRDFARAVLGGLATQAVFAKLDSNFGGVQIGINAPYSFRRMHGSAEDVIRNMQELGLSSVEIRSQPIEHFLGGPVAIQGEERPQDAARIYPGGFKRPTAQEDAADRSRLEAIRNWRRALPRKRFAEARDKFRDAGISIDVVKFDDLTNRVDAMADDEIDYCFEMTKALGARAISCEPPVSKTRRLGSFALKHRLPVGYHGHLSKDPDEFSLPASWERAAAFSPFNRINLDIGHFTAAGGDALGFIRQHHDRITHIHLKDRKANDGPNLLWGQGDTPVKEVLQLMKKERYGFPAVIEFEYAPPEGSSVMAEIAKCVQFCKNALL